MTDTLPRPRTRPSRPTRACYRRARPQRGPRVDLDRDLIQRFVTLGDERAFAQLVERHWGLAYGLAYRCLGEALSLIHI